MRIVFVRHGHPNYVDDCLTDLGKLQAEAASQKLIKEGIKEIYSSTCGRAFETAQVTADKLGLEVIPLDFMRELRWGKKFPEAEIYHEGHPWDTAELLFHKLGYDLNKNRWKEHPYFRDNQVLDSVKHVEDCFMDWMSHLGFSYKDGKWFCERENNDTVALFSHGGAGGAALAKLLGWEFAYSILAIGMNYTSITVINVPAKQGSWSLPRIERMNDDSHVNVDKITFEM